MTLLTLLTPTQRACLLTTAFGLTAVASTACDLADPDDPLACTEIACAQNGLRIEVRSDADALPEGEYSFDLLADDVEFTAVCHSTATTCEAERTDGVPMADSELSVWIAPVAGGFDIDVLRVSEMDLLGPEHVEIDVTFENQASTGEFDPDYESDQPNGEGCGVCEYATVSLGLASPEHG